MMSVPNHAMSQTPPPIPPVSPPPAVVTPVTPSEQDVRTWCMLCHLAALAGYAVALGQLLGPLIVWLIKKDQMPAVDAHGKEAVNFHISCMIYAIVSFLLIFVCIGIVLLPAVAILNIVCTIVASVKASQGEFF